MHVNRKVCIQDFNAIVCLRSGRGHGWGILSHAEENILASISFTDAAHLLL
jgi:hypothetical protein